MPTKMTDEKKSQVPEGWREYSVADTFSAHAGPFYYRDPALKTPGVGFLAEKRHGNFHGVVHGGVIMTLADMALFNIAFHAIGPFHGVTLSTSIDFIAGGEVGAFIIATGEATKSTGSILFVRGLITSNNTTIASFSGSMKRFK